MTVSLSLLAGAGWQFFDDNGNPLSGGLLYTYEAGTTTPAITYTSSSGATANPNPVVLDAAGRVPEQIWLSTAYTYKFLLRTSAGVSIWSKDNIPATVASTVVQFIQAGAGAVPRTAQSKMRDFVSVLDFGADPTGAADSTNAFNNATAVPVFIPAGTYRTDGTVTGAQAAIALGAAFTGSAPYDSWTPAFGISTMEVYANGIRNSLIGAARNTATPATLGFPTGVTGLGRNDNAGNTAFGVYAEGRQYATSGVVVGAELDSFNMTGTAPTNTTTPNRSIGTPQQLPNAVTIAAGGTAASWCGVHVAREGSSPQSFLYGMLFDANAVTESAIVIEASLGVGPALPMLVKHKTSQIAAQFQGVGAPISSNAWMQYVDGALAVQIAFYQDGSIDIQGDQVLTNRQTGWTSPTGTAVRTSFNTATVTLPQLAERVKALIDDLTTHGLIGA